MNRLLARGCCAPGQSVPQHTDVHQHLWPEPFLDELRRRSRAPYLREWTLHTESEPPFEVQPEHHDPLLRRTEAATLLSLSTPIGVEALEPDDAAPLLAAWHAGSLALGTPFATWAAVTELEPDLAGLDSLLATEGVVGLQIAATQLGTPGAVEAAGPVLRRCELANKPVLVHPGPITPASSGPEWWPAVVAYPAQLQAAWWAWHHVGRALFPHLRICFAAGAGLAPVGHERFSVRSGSTFVVDPHVFVDTSSYGRQGIDALTRALGIDAVVLGSDRPYAEATDPLLGEAAWRSISTLNPHHLLTGERAA